MASSGELASFALNFVCACWELELVIYGCRLCNLITLILSSLTQVLSISLFWTGAVLCNTVHVIVSGTVVLVSIHGGREAVSIPANSFMNHNKCSQKKSLKHIVDIS